MTPPPEPRSVRRRNLREDVADRLRNDILTGRLTPGKRIDQDQLAAELGVSQLPVREALIQLDQEGLVETIARRGSYVPQLTPEDIADQYRIFGLVSGLACARAAENLSEEQLTQLREVNDQLAIATDTAEQERLNFEFHRIINLAGSSRRLLSTLRLLARSLPANYYDFAHGWQTAACAEHEIILRALEARDGDGAQRAMVSHLSDGGRHAVSQLTELGYFSNNQ